MRHGDYVVILATLAVALLVGIFPPWLQRSQSPIEPAVRSSRVLCWWFLVSPPTPTAFPLLDGDGKEYVPAGGAVLASIDICWGVLALEWACAALAGAIAFVSIRLWRLRNQIPV